MALRLTAFLFLCLLAVPVWAHSPCYKALTEPGYMPPEVRAYQTNLLNSSLKPYAIAKPQRLKIATWNTNLLNVRGWKAHFYPINSARLSGLLARYLQNEKPDVLMLQEMWAARDRATVRILAMTLGYTVIDDPAARGRHGMQMLVRSEIVGGILGSGFVEFGRSNYVIFEMVGSVRRGLLWTRIQLRDGQVLLIGNTHFTAFSKYAWMRERQMKELSQAMRIMSPGAHHTLIGGDLNIAADFNKGRDETWNQALENTRWLYDQFAIDTGLRDIFRAVNTEDPGFTYNPLVESELNPKYNGTDRRLDYLWTAENTPGVKSHVLDVQLLFREKIAGVYPSDHFMVQATVEYFQLPF